MSAEHSAFYRVEASGKPDCTHCGAGQMWTVCWTDASGEDCQISSDYSDQDLVEDLCTLMNMAYETGRASR